MFVFPFFGFRYLTLPRQTFDPSIYSLLMPRMLAVFGGPHQSISPSSSLIAPVIALHSVGPVIVVDLGYWQGLLTVAWLKQP